MEEKIPFIVDILYQYLSSPPDPRFWPDHLQDNPVNAHGLYSFYQGLQLGLQLACSCLKTL